ncbi:MAG: hypothetical protein ACI9J2_000670 [Saprospiraceae bacterium]|jgi:hypothetical protein
MVIGPVMEAGAAQLNCCMAENEEVTVWVRVESALALPGQVNPAAEAPPIVDKDPILFGVGMLESST